MNRYLIIDLDKNKKEQHLIIPLINSLKSMGVVLSEEETEAKFKEVFKQGFLCGEKLSWIQQDIEESFNQFKKRL